VTLLNRLLGRTAEAAARALIEAARSAAPDLARDMGVDEARGRGAALLLAKLCFDRTAASSSPLGQAGLHLSARASKLLYPAIATELGGTATDAGQRYVELADAVRRGLDSRAPSESGAVVVSRELRRAVAGNETPGEASPALTASVGHLIAVFNAIAARELGAPRSST
jgi:hypothetical protein